MPAAVTVRRARVDDAAAIAGVYVDAWRSAYAGILPDRGLVRLSTGAQTRAWTRALRSGAVDGSILVAERAANGVVGVGSIGEARTPALPHAGEIYALYVAPDHHDQGIGRTLLYRLFDALIDRGLNSTLAWVMAENPARFFYEAMGARRVGERDQQLWNAAHRQAAYGWNDLRIVPRRGDVRTD